jgi:Fe-S-cluster containining protein
VWISQKEIARVAESVKLDVDEVVQRYCRQIGPRWSLQERLNGGNYDCIFLEEQRGVRPGEVRRICTVYAVRPLQCRT